MSGIFGVVSKGECIKDLFYGTDYHSHLGTAFGGIAVLGKRPKIHKLDAQFKSKFSGILSEYAGIGAGIGVISADEEQPLEVLSRFGHFAICTNGRINNLEKITKELLAEGKSFTEISSSRKVNQTEVAAKIIAKEKGVVEGIERLFDVSDGSLSLLILNNEGLYAARAKYGHSVLAIGRKEDSWAVATETCAFNNLGYKTIKELMPGEIALITKDGPRQMIEGNAINQICAFLWIYTGYPASVYDGINVEEARYRCGAMLARRDMQDKRFKPDIVAGVPDSGLAHAIGYSNESGIVFKRPLVKYTDGYGRSYIPSLQEERDLIAKMKLIAIPEIAKGKSIVLLEDSIVRGTQLKNFTVTKLWEAGAREIHVRPACPPLMYPCKFNVSTRVLEELIARRVIKKMEGTIEPKNIIDYINHDSPKFKEMVTRIAEELNITSLRYQRLDDMVEAIGLPKDKLCTYCWDGEEI